MAELRIDEKKGIVIYGAGYYAERVYGYLFLRELWGMVKFVVVSDGETHNECFHGKTIEEFSKKQGVMRECQIIIALSPKNAANVLEKINDALITKYICLTDVFMDELVEEYGRLCDRYPIQKNKVFFDAYNGSGYTCNCKYISEKLIELTDDLQMIWDLLRIIESTFPKRIRTVLKDSPEYFYELYTSSVVVFNATINPNIKYKKRGQYYINTWHGIGPFKKVGYSVNNRAGRGPDLPEYNGIQNMVDLMVAASDHCVDVYRNSIGYQGEIQKWGYPRNDVFFAEDNTRDNIYKYYNIDKDSRLVLYAPTYRYGLQNADSDQVMQTYDLDPRELVKALELRYGCKYVFMYRFHHIIYKGTEVKHNAYGYGIDVTTHPDMQELLVAADVLITDWSSSIWDFSLTRKQGKRVFLYQNDIERATELNGFYMPPDQLPFPKGRTTEELCEAILTYDDEQYMRDVDAFFDKYGCYDDGHASERVAERIIDVIEHPEKYGKEGKS